MPKDLTLPQLQQLMAYAQQSEDDEWYYGNKAQFRKRHEDIKLWLMHAIEAKQQKRRTLTSDELANCGFLSDLRE